LCDGEGIEITDMGIEITAAETCWALGEAVWDGDNFWDVRWGVGELLFPCYSLVDRSLKES